MKHNALVLAVALGYIFVITGCFEYQPYAMDPETEALLAKRRSEYVRRTPPPPTKTEVKPKTGKEYNFNGLVLLVDSVVGTHGKFSIEITGTVVNRRGSKLSYAQIEFNLYDTSGARVGTAHDIINGLESGERWKFKAVAFEPNADQYKFSELSGF